MMKPYRKNRDYLVDWIRWLNAKLYWETERFNATERMESVHYMSSEEVQNILNRDVFEEGGVYEREVEGILEEIRSRVELTKSGDGELPRLLYLRERFGLGEVEEKVLVICLAPEIYPRYGKVYGFLQDDLSAKLPSIYFILRLLDGRFPEKFSYLRYFSDCSALVHFRLIQKIPVQGSGLGQTLVKLDDRLCSFLLDEGEGLETFSPFLKRIWPRRSFRDILVEAEVIQQLKGIGKLVDESPVLYFRGIEGIGKREAAEAFCKMLSMPLFFLEAADIPTDKGLFQEFLRAVDREVRLQNGALYFNHLDEILFHPGLESFYRSFLRGLLAEADYPIFIGATGHHRFRLRGKAVFEVEFRVPSLEERKRQWMRLAKVRSRVGEYLASTFALSGPLMEEAYSLARLRAKLAQNGQNPARIRLEDLRAGCLSQSQHNLSSLAHQIRPFYDFEDLVLPEETLQILKELCFHIRYKHKIYVEWGFGKKFSSGCLASLFVGQSGTGKTMAAEVIAKEVGMDLFRIDLARIISKFIGETEKNLSKIFDEAEQSQAILFFDEADALFGKRSEVESAHDRYANIETDYLLQRIERFEGVVILATNFQENIDDAFLRRMRFLVEFPNPDVQHRLKIWQKAFPPDAPLAKDVDFAFLAEHLPIAGGNIRNIALNAAFLAAQEKEIRMEHLILSAKREYDKMGRRVTERDFGRYYPLVKDKNQL
ncbi:MAG: ATP-binding protein [Planctomycetota bacterium]|nr:MAG: ATP-binding protein [Planctomycetota bacterium]